MSKAPPRHTQGCTPKLKGQRCSNTLPHDQPVITRPMSKSLAVNSRRKLTDEQEQAICARYLAGENTMELAPAFGLTHAWIGVVLRRNGVKMRSLSEAKGGLSADAMAEVCRRYTAGENTVQLGAEFSVTSNTIGNILKRNGIELRKGTPQHVATQVCRRYVAGESLPQLAKAFALSASTIRNILLREQVPVRTCREAQGGLPIEAEAEVCARYEAGESANQIGAQFGTSDTAIRGVLKRNNVKIRTAGESQKGRENLAKRKFDAAQEQEICHRYVDGATTVDLATAFGTNDVTVGNILKRNGIERRIPNAFGDSVQHILDCTGHHSTPRECEFYLYELARYALTHCKPGIAFDADVRVGVGGGEYGEAVLRLYFATRAEAYFLEQAVQDQTRGYRDCPENLQGWSGASEIRAMPAEDMVPIVLRLADELEQLGPWAFAAAYVPMTASQRAICQQRAMQEVKA